MLILLVHNIYAPQIRQEKRAALEEGLRRPPSQPLPSLRPLSQPPSLRYLWISPLSWSQGPYNDKSLIFSSQTTSDLPTMALAGWPPVARPEVPHVDSRTGVDQCCLWYFSLLNIFDSDLLCFRTPCYFCQQHLPGRKLLMAKVKTIPNSFCDANFIYRSSTTS